MFEFKRFEVNALSGSLVNSAMSELAYLGNEGWQIKAAIRGLTGNTEILYLEREVEDE